MKTLKIKNDMTGMSTEVNANKTYEKTVTQWVAEVDEAEFRRACDIYCSGIEGCSCDDMHGQADLDDDGKDYRIMSN